MLRNAFVVVLVLAVITVVAASFLHPKISTESAARPLAVSPVLVELFTSEGCSSCPPADKLLADLDRAGTADGVPVIALGEHVDYWDGLGWHDRFSSKIFTERQADFVRHLGISSAYTPQMVVDGRLELVGNDDNALHHALDQATHSPKSSQIALAWVGEKLRIQVTDHGSHSGDILLAVTESDLTTRVERGENGGRVLHHAAVVRQLSRLGQLKDAEFASTASIPADPSWKKENLKAVVFVQDERTREVLGASAIAFP